MSDFPLLLEPEDRVLFEGKLGEQAIATDLKIANPTADRIAFKIRCTDNSMFRMHPVIDVVKAKDDTSVMLIFNAVKPVPESGKHYFSIHTITAVDERKNGRTLWEEHTGGPEGYKKLFVDFKKVTKGDSKDDFRPQ